ncbi:hypothetical protein [Xylella taiwanensis]|nr:hypothetical protein [Xylella taiwanensis]
MNLGGHTATDAFLLFTPVLSLHTQTIVKSDHRSNIVLPVATHNETDVDIPKQLQEVAYEESEN